MCFYFYGFGWLVRVRDWLEFAVLVTFDFSKFVWLSYVRGQLEFSVLVFFLVIFACIACFFSFEVRVYSICWHLSLLGALIWCNVRGVGLTLDYSYLSHMYWCGRLWSRSHMDD